MRPKNEYWSVGYAQSSYNFHHIGPRKVPLRGYRGQTWVSIHKSTTMSAYACRLSHSTNIGPSRGTYSIGWGSLIRLSDHGNVSHENPNLILSFRLIFLPDLWPTRVEPADQLSYKIRLKRRFSNYSRKTIRQGNTPSPSEPPNLRSKLLYVQFGDFLKERAIDMSSTKSSLLWQKRLDFCLKYRNFDWRNRLVSISRSNI